MAVSPSTRNYTLGRGELFFNEIDPSTGEFLGERHMGNAPDVNFNINVELLDHFQSMSGFRAKDLKAVMQVAPQISFTLDELSTDNWKLLVYGQTSAVTQNAQVDETFAIVNPTAGRTYNLGWRSVAGYRLTHGTVTNGPFVAGDTITGGTSSATATILSVNNAQGYVVIDTPVGGPFEAAETITGGTAATTATVTAPETLVDGQVVIREQADPTAVLTINQDYIVNARAGLVTFTVGTEADDATTYEAFFQVKEATYSEIRALQNTQQRGQIRFVSNNPEGPQYILYAWVVDLSPDGDTAMIGDEWATISFMGDVLRDAQNHPESPFMTIQVDE